MARYPVVSGAVSQNNPLTVIVDTNGRAMGVTIQNVSAQDFYISTDPATLQNTSPTNLPQVGHHFAADSVPPFILVLPSFKGKIYARSQNAGAAAEANTYENC